VPVSNHVSTCDLWRPRAQAVEAGAFVVEYLGEVIDDNTCEVGGCRVYGLGFRLRIYNLGFRV